MIAVLARRRVTIAAIAEQEARRQVMIAQEQAQDLQTELDLLRKQVNADVFKPMDGGIALSAEEIMGRNTWNLWSAGNDRFWNNAARQLRPRGPFENAG